MWKNKTLIFITVGAFVISVGCLISTIFYEKTLDDTLKDLSITFLGVFASIIIINVLIEKAFEREKERNIKSEKEKEKKEWYFIHLYLTESILNTGIAALNLLPTVYQFLLENDISEEISKVPKYMILQNFTDFDEERRTYSLYLSRFIHKLEKEQVKNYRTFETFYNDIKKPDLLFWGQLVKSNDFSNLTRKSLMRSYFDNVGKILRFSEYYLTSAFPTGLINNIKSKVEQLTINDFHLKSSSHIRMFELSDPKEYFEDYKSYGFDFSNTIAHFFLCVKYSLEYDKHFYKK